MSGALTIGELVGFIRADDTGMRRGLASSQLRMRGFQLDTNNRLRDLRGRFVSETRVMSMSLRDDLTGAITIANRATNQFTTDANGRLRDVRGRFVAAGHAARQMGDDTRQATQNSTRDLTRLKDVLGKVAGMAGGLARVAGSLAPIAGAIGAGVPLGAALVATLQNMAPAAGVGVSALLAVQQASAVVKLAAVGMDDALSSALDPAKSEEFAEALKKLSPEARAFALAVKDAAPALRDLQQDVQNRVFQGLAEDLERAGRSAFPVVRRELLDTAGALNLMGRGALDAAKGLAEDGTLGKAMGSASKGLLNLSGIPGVVATALGQVAAAAGPSFERLTEKAGDAAFRIGDKLGKAFESGAMERAIEDAIDLIGDLLDVGGNVGTVLSNVFGAAQASGGGLVGTLEKITGALADITATDEFQDALQALMSVTSNLADNVLPLLATAFEMLLPVITEISPFVNDLVDILGEELAKALPELTPLLEEAAKNFGELAPIIGELIPPLMEIVTAALPIMGIYLQLTAELLQLLAPAMVGVAEAAAFLAGIFSDFAVGAFEALTNAGRILVDLLQGDFSGAWEIAKGSVSGFTVAALGSVAEFVGGARRSFTEFVSDAVSRLASLPGQAVSVLGNLGGVLTGSGRALIQGFINGILGMIGSVREAAGSVVSAAREYFPFSPAKKGPFAGRGYTVYSGQALMEGFRKGIELGMPGVRSSLDRMPGLSPVLEGLGMGGGLALPGDLAMAGLGGSEATRVEVINRTVLDVRGGDDEFLRMIRRWVDIEGGGNVQDALGKGAA
ncbi:phage tail protein [Streptomyces ossamyceticus]|uniref:phage tail protein n=1 Tax=Streptomyces ossamyceticus TaxID=249581 RepID=UPI00341BF411